MGKLVTTKLDNERILLISIKAYIITSGKIRCLHGDINIYLLMNSGS